MIKDWGLEAVYCAVHNAHGLCVLLINGTNNDITTSGCQQRYQLNGVVICGAVVTHELGAAETLLSRPWDEGEETRQVKHIGLVVWHVGCWSLGGRSHAKDST
ncbi:hypothetical protein SLA2020_420790 [Shorea laevis]